MKVIIVGAGEVGFQVVRSLSKEKVDIVVVDMDGKKIKNVLDAVDVAAIEGEGGSPSTLKEIGAASADLFLALTNSDETNMIACLIAKSMFNIPRKIVRLRNPEYYKNESLLNNLDIKQVINPEVESAKAIKRLLEVPFSSVVEDFEDGLIKVIGVKIQANCNLIGKSLKELRMEFKDRFLIGIIQNDDNVLIPSGDNIIRVNDIVYLPVPKDEVMSVIPLIFGNHSKPFKNIMILGGGRIGYNLALLLEKDGDFNIKIIEPDIKRCKFLTNNLSSTMVIHGDGSDRALMEEENISDMDVLAALTNNEELNIMSSLLAKKLGIEQTITIVNRVDYINLAHSLGIQVVLSPRLITASSILRYVRKESVLSLTTLAEDKAEVIEAVISEKSVLKDMPLKKAKIPKTTLIGAIIRDNEVIIPSGEDYIRVNDKVVIFTLREGIRKIEKIL